jgi:tetratricopeptide (TPR) repeat protein
MAEGGAARAVQMTLGLALRRFTERRLAESEALYRRALEMYPGHADALNMLGVVLAERGNPLQALKYIEEAIRIAPASAAYHTNRGEILRRWGMHEEGLAACARAVELDPNSPEARNNLGLALLGRQACAEALPHFQAAIVLQPGMAPARMNLGRALKGLGRWPEAAVALREAVAANAGYAEAWYELATVEERMGEAEASVESCRRALECRAEFPEACVALGDAWDALGKGEQAREAYRRALQLNPAYSVASYQLSLCLLGQGYFAEGWKLYESRFDPAIPGGQAQPVLPMPMWQGEELLGKRLLVLTEQGYGDHVQFIRFVPLLARRGVDIIVGASPEMRALTETLEGVQRVITQVEEAWDCGCDYWTFVGSLPLRLGIGAGRVPAPVPYLRADPQRVQAWRERLAARSGVLKVGIVWAGRPTHGNDWRRSIALKRFAPLAGVAGVAFYALQTGDRAADAHDAPAGLELIPLGQELKDFADTAALLAGLDLLISADTATAHLAGALARPVWTLLPFQSDWRWRLDTDLSRWYPTMRLFRQQRPGDWDEVLGRAAQALAAETAARPSVNGPA